MLSLFFFFAAWLGMGRAVGGVFVVKGGVCCGENGS